MLILHSETINSFIARLYKYARDIMRSEMGLEVQRTRFSYNGYRVPFRIVVFEKKGELGFYDHSNYRIGLHVNLMYSAKTEVIKNVLRHELAHMMVAMDFGRNPKIAPHGAEYKNFCHKLGWEKRVSKAQTDIEQENGEILNDFPSEKVISKVQKLLNLSSSNNPHEAEMATLKANQLLLAHNLRFIDKDCKDDEIAYVKVVFRSKKMTAKYSAICSILKTFFVATVNSYGQDGVNLTVVGPKLSVELADYVASFLENELETLWKKSKKANPHIKGAGQKKSFMEGLAEGYTAKIRLAQMANADTKSLVKIEHGLEKQKQMAFPRLSTHAIPSGKTCYESKTLGFEKGLDLSITPGISSKGTKSNKFLTL